MARNLFRFILICLALSFFMAAGPMYRIYKFHQTPEMFRMEIMPDEGVEQMIQ